jgi:hypothetical protein
METYPLCAFMIWSLSTRRGFEALHNNLLFVAATQVSGGPTAEELLKLLDQCDLSNSHCSTPCISPCPSMAATAAARIKASNVAFLNQSQEATERGGGSAGSMSC